MTEPVPTWNDLPAVTLTEVRVLEVIYERRCLSALNEMPTHELIASDLNISRPRVSRVITKLKAKLLLSGHADLPRSWRVSPMGRMVVGRWKIHKEREP